MPAYGYPEPPWTATWRDGPSRRNRAASGVDDYRYWAGCPRRGSSSNERPRHTGGRTVPGRRFMVECRRLTEHSSQFARRRHAPVRT